MADCVHGLIYSQCLILWCLFYCSHLIFLIVLKQPDSSLAKSLCIWHYFDILIQCCVSMMLYITLHWYSDHSMHTFLSSWQCCGNQYLLSLSIHWYFWYVISDCAWWLGDCNLPLHCHYSGLLSIVTADSASQMPIRALLPSADISDLHSVCVYLYVALWPCWLIVVWPYKCHREKSLVHLCCPLVTVLSLHLTDLSNLQSWWRVLFDLYSVSSDYLYICWWLIPFIDLCASLLKPHLTLFPVWWPLHISLLLFWSFSRHLTLAFGTFYPMMFHFSLTSLHSFLILWLVTFIPLFSLNSDCCSAPCCLSFHSWLMTISDSFLSFTFIF